MNSEPFVAKLFADGLMRTALIVATGIKYYQCIWPDAAMMRVRRVPLATQLDVLEDYPVSKAKKRLRHCCKIFGSRPNARRLLRG